MKTVTTIQISIYDLEKILNEANEAIKNDNSLSKTLELDLIRSSETWLASDRIAVRVKSVYQECNGKTIRTSVYK